MGFKPRPPPPPADTPEKTKKKSPRLGSSPNAGTSPKSPGLLKRKSLKQFKSNSWWNLNEVEEEKPKSVRSSKTLVPPSPAPRKSKIASQPDTPVNNTRKTVFRHKVCAKGQVLYEWEQNPKFVTIYYPTPDADYKAFCNIAQGHVQLGTKPKKLPTRWFLSHDTGGPVDVDESHWKQCKQHCRIVLCKENKNSTWTRPLKDDRVDDTFTTKQARPKLERAQSVPGLSPETPKRKVSKRSVFDSDDEEEVPILSSKNKSKKRQSRRSVIDSDDEEDSDIDSEKQTKKRLSALLSPRVKPNKKKLSKRSVIDSDDADSDSEKQVKKRLSAILSPRIKPKKKLQVPRRSFTYDTDDFSDDSGEKMRRRHQGSSKNVLGSTSSDVDDEEAGSARRRKSLRSNTSSGRVKRTDDEENHARLHRSKSRDPTLMRRGRSASQGRRRMSKTGPPERRASSAERPMSTIFVDKDAEQNNDDGERIPRRRSASRGRKVSSATEITRSTISRTSISVDKDAEQDIDEAERRPRRRSGSQGLRKGLPQRKKSFLASAENFVTKIFVDKDAEQDNRDSAGMRRPRSASQGRRKTKREVFLGAEDRRSSSQGRRTSSRGSRGRRKTKKDAVLGAADKPTSRSFGGTDDDLPTNIEVDVESDLISVLGASAHPKNTAPTDKPMQRRISRADRPTSRSFGGTDVDLPTNIKVDLNSDVVSVLGASAHCRK